MKKRTKIWLVVGAVLMLLGAALLVCEIVLLKGDLSKLSTVKLETNTYDISEDFDSISVYTDTADIIFVLSDDGKCKVECYEEENAKHLVSVSDGTLSVKITNEKSWYDYIGINVSSPKITVSLPRSEYNMLLIDGATCAVKIPDGFCFVNVDISLSTGAIDFAADSSSLLKLKTSTGGITVKNASAVNVDIVATTGKVSVSSVSCTGDASIGVSTGRVYLTDVSCSSLTSSGGTGDAVLKNVIATEKLFIKRSTGDVKLDRCDAAEIRLETSTGDVNGSLLSEKIFTAETSTGSVNVPNTKNGGPCFIKTSTGDIKISIG